MYPDPVAQPGHTWTPIPGEREVFDRIDFIFHRDHSTGFPASQAKIKVQTTKAYLVEGKADGNYYTDHRMVVTDQVFSWAPAPPGALVGAA